MNQKSRFLVSMVVLAALLITAGCDNGTTSTEFIQVPVPGETVYVGSGGIQPYTPPSTAIPAGSFAALEGWLADTSGVYNEIIYAAVPTAAITVPVGKTLYLNGTAGLTLSADITINGKVVVYSSSGSGGVNAGTHFNKAGSGILEIERLGSLEVPTDALFTGNAKPATITIKANASLISSVALSDAADVTKWVGYSQAGNLSLSTAVTTVKPTALLAAIGPQSNKSVQVSTAVNEDSTGTLTVPSGVFLTVSGGTYTALTGLVVDGVLLATGINFPAVTSLTVNGYGLMAGDFNVVTTINVAGAGNDLASTTVMIGAAGATPGNAVAINVDKASLTATGAVGGTSGATIVFGSSTTLITIQGAVTLATDVVVPKTATLSFGSGAVTFNPKKVTWEKGRDKDTNELYSDVDLIATGYTATGGWVLEDVTLGETEKIVIPASFAVTIPAGKKITNGGTITNNGTINLAATAELILTTTASSVGKIDGAGTIVAGATEIAGEWEAVGGAGGKVTILSAATGATITAATGATELKASANTATITQAAGSGNALTIGAATTIALGGDGAKVGSIVLKGAAADPGKLTFTHYAADAGTSLVTTSPTSITPVKVTDTVSVPAGGTALVWWAAAATSNTSAKWSKVGASAASNGLVGGGAGVDLELSGATSLTSS